MPLNKAKKAYKMPPHLPEGEVFEDIQKIQWLLGSSVGKGGFGEIYLATRMTASASKAEYVIKIEPLENGPLFTEIALYRRVAKDDKIIRWMSDKHLCHLPIPRYVTSGLHTFKEKEYRFLVMERFGTDLDKYFKLADSRFSEATVCYLALRLLEALEFLHDSGYAHADIKAANLLVGLGKEQGHQIYLVDYGLASKFLHEGVHREYKHDPRRAHDGTLEFTSIDAHNGALPARRGDLEILGYCLLLWASGNLPWIKQTDKLLVAEAKKSYHGDVSRLVKDCFHDIAPGYLVAYMSAIYQLDYSERPLYEKLKDIFSDQLGLCDPIKTLEWLSSSGPPIKRSSELVLPSVVKKRRMNKGPAKHLKAFSAPILAAALPNHECSSSKSLVAPPLLPHGARTTCDRMMMDDKSDDSLAQNKPGGRRRGECRKRKEELDNPAIPHKSAERSGAVVAGPVISNTVPLRRSQRNRGKTPPRYE